jgi:hypothetical protein
VVCREKRYSAGLTALALVSGASCARLPALGFAQIAQQFLVALLVRRLTTTASYRLDSSSRSS